MKQCPSCGAPLEDGYTFCPHCGASCSHAEEGKRCPNCGAPVEEGYTFCVNCGASVRSSGGEGAHAAPADPFADVGHAAPPPPQGAPLPAGKQRPVNRSGISGLIVGIVALIFFWMPGLNVLFAFAGLVLSTTGLCLFRSCRLSGLAVASLILNCVAMLLAVLMIFGMFSS